MVFATLSPTTILTLSTGMEEKGGEEEQEEEQEQEEDVKR
jgi:hypothetical protein